MAKAKGINAHKVFKLGKAAAKKDKRNLKFATLLRATTPALPDNYDFDVAHSGLATMSTAIALSLEGHTKRSDSRTLNKGRY